MRVAYGLTFLAVLCVIAAVRGTRFPGVGDRHPHAQIEVGQQATAEPVLSFGLPRIDPQVPMVTTAQVVNVLGASSLSASASMSGTTVAPPGGFNLTRYASFAFANVVNEQSAPGIGEAARRAVLQITFYKDGTEDVVLGPINGRWRESPPAQDLSPYQVHTDALAIDLEPNGQTHELDVAFKYQEEQDCYAYNNDNAYAKHSQPAKHRLASGHYRVKVEVNGSNFPPLIAWYRLTNPGAHQVLEIEEA